MTLAIGIFSTLLACFGGLLGNLLEAATSVINFFGGALVGVFLLGMLSKRVGPKGALAGFLVGFATVIAVAGLTDISFMWYSAVGGMVTLLIGNVISVIIKEEVSLEQKRLVFGAKDRGDNGN